MAAAVKLGNCAAFIFACLLARLIRVDRLRDYGELSNENTHGRYGPSTQLAVSIFLSRFRVKGIGNGKTSTRAQGGT